MSISFEISGLPPPGQQDKVAISVAFSQKDSLINSAPPTLIPAKTLGRPNPVVQISATTSIPSSERRARQLRHQGITKRSAPTAGQDHVRLRQVQEIIDYRFSNSSILMEALRACRSRRCTYGNDVMADGNKRLAIVGDAVLKLVLASVWYDLPADRGFFSKEMERIGSNSNLSRVGHELYFDAFIDIHPSQLGQPVSVVTMATTIEAVLGAVWEDSGHSIEYVKDVMDALNLTINKAIRPKRSMRFVVDQGRVANCTSAAGEEVQGGTE